MGGFLILWVGGGRRSSVAVGAWAFDASGSVFLGSQLLYQREGLLQNLDKTGSCTRRSREGVSRVDVVNKCQRRVGEVVNKLRHSEFRVPRAMPSQYSPHSPAVPGPRPRWRPQNQKAGSRAKRRCCRRTARRRSTSTPLTFCSTAIVAQLLWQGRVFINLLLPGKRK